MFMFFQKFRFGLKIYFLEALRALTGELLMISS